MDRKSITVEILDPRSGNWVEGIGSTVAAAKANALKRLKPVDKTNAKPRHEKQSPKAFPAFPR
jgi:hypothetical protein